MQVSAMAMSMCWMTWWTSCTSPFWMLLSAASPAASYEHTNGDLQLCSIRRSVLCATMHIQALEPQSLRHLRRLRSRWSRSMTRRATAAPPQAS
jgi:hypothetical protein